MKKVLLLVSAAFATVYLSIASSFAAFSGEVVSAADVTASTWELTATITALVWIIMGMAGFLIAKKYGDKILNFIFWVFK